MTRRDFCNSLNIEINMIDHYAFGSIRIDGKEYQSDVIIYPDWIDSSWWRKEGHSLVPEDVKEIIKHKPAILIVGCGATGAMKISSATREFINQQGIKLIAQNTDEACQEFNRRKEKNENIIVALHLTC